MDGIVILSVLCAVLYGILHDQITARICVEYFTIGHPQIVPTENPTLLGLVWGVVATWWVGLILGIPLAIVATVGSHPKRTAVSLVGPLALVMLCSAMFALLAGCVGYIAARNRWVVLMSPLAEKVPHEKHIPFLVDLWVHNASYCGGFVGGLFLMFWVWRVRNAKAREIQNESSKGE